MTDQIRELIVALNIDTVVFSIGLLCGFTLGYAVRASMSFRRRQAAMKRRYLELACWAVAPTSTREQALRYNGA